jgi:hypothetical protein
MMWITNAILWLIYASALEAARKYERHSTENRLLLEFSWAANDAFHAQDWRLA